MDALRISKSSLGEKNSNKFRDPLEVPKGNAHFRMECNEDQQANRNNIERVLAESSLYIPRVVNKIARSLHASINSCSVPLFNIGSRDCMKPSRLDNIKRKVKCIHIYKKLLVFYYVRLVTIEKDKDRISKSSSSCSTKRSVNSVTKLNLTSSMTFYVKVCYV